MAVLRVGLIGCGGISRAHAAGYRLNRDVARVVAVCDARRDEAVARAEELGAEAVYDDYRHLLAARGGDAVDAVDICLPHHLHAEVAIAATRASKHVLVEKPIANTLAEAQAMVEAAQAAGFP